ncbi:Transglycosylase-associated protein [Methylobacterium sp. 4-46]|uniref:GlsB/YeaQ/YmgE family stress response membrane protein n=1 Tax=unclassified Methylobacterium TaxID=2615210 RepID=UPI000152CE9D|nr:MULTISPECIES: GlsB/YeaQ/YmgE family stress response membrane protein [Methylobacterium]ACA20204.1 Transglycosylase-associated protein [Methylobacterium sp. 4-46]WFT79384.1 GlsB/YeaQ/YmgE family stress response membrane protein [Methylobacterium nodulans]
MNGHIYGALGQPGVGFFMAIVIGALAGWLAEKFTSSTMGLLANIVLGIIGGVVGNFLAAQLHIPIFGFWRNLISATVGAVIVITVYRAVKGQRPTY